MFSLDKLQRLFLALGFFLFLMYSFRRGLAGGYFWIQLAIAFLVLGIVVFWFKDHFWVLIPITLLSKLTTIQIAGRNVRAAEIAIIVCLLIFLLNMAMLRTPLRIRFSKTWPVYFHFLWVAAIYAINPAGLAITGSQDIGARFYFAILLGALAVLILANQSVSEKEAKLVIFVSIVLSFFHPLTSYIGFQEIGLLSEPERFYSWHQSLTTPANLLLYYLLARHRKFTLASLLLFTMTLGLVMLSGKRAIFMVTAVLPLISSVLLNRSFSQAFARGFAMLALLAVLILSQGILFSMPRVAQRAMAMLPGRWDPSVENLATDIFRTEMRKLAWSEINTAPLMGRKGYTLNREEVIYSLSSSTGRSGSFESHAYVANWHSAWLAFWVDFGLPAVLLYAAFMILCIVFGYRLFQSADNKDYRHTLTGMLLLLMTSNLITSYTSGHSGLTPFSQWWVLGLMVAIDRGVRQENKGNISEPTDSETTPTLVEDKTQTKSIPPKHIPSLPYPATNS